jgi:type III secretory pathway component EscV
MTMSQQIPSAIPVIVELTPELAFLGAPEGIIAQQFPGQIARGLADLAHQLGIPGRPRVEVKTSDAPLPRLYVHGSLRPFSLQLVQELFAYFSDVGLSSKRLTFSWPPEIKESLSDKKLAALMVQLVVEVAKQRPEILLSAEQTAVYLRPLQKGLPGATSLPLPRVTRILKHVLKLGLSIANTELVIEHVAQAGAEKCDDHDLAESLAPGLRSDAITIEMQGSYLQALVGVQLVEGQSILVNDARLSEQVRDQFKMLSDALFYELGIRVPDIVLAASARIQQRYFSIKVDHYKGLPSCGLEPDQLLVNDTVANVSKVQKDAPNVGRTGLQVAAHAQDLFQRLGITPSRQPAIEKPQLTVTALEAINPANDKEASVVGIEDKQAIEKIGLYVWNPVGYLILAVSRNLRQNAWRLLDIEAVEYELAQLHELFPELVSAVMEKISVAQLTQVLRELLGDQIAIRDLRSILERILTYDYIVTDPSKFIVFDDRLAFSEEPKLEEINNPRHYVQHVRAGLKQYLTHKLTRGQNTLIVYLLDVQIEKQILDHLAAERVKEDKIELTPSHAEKILSAVRAEVSSLPPTAALPVILTISEIRAFVRELVAPEFPNLFVVSYDELSPDSNIQPIARISL